MRNAREKLNWEQVFTEDSLRALFKEAGIILPSDDDDVAELLRRLAGKLETVRGFFCVEQHIEPANDAKGSALKALRDFDDALTQIEGEEKKILDAAVNARDELMADVLRDRLREIDRLRGKSTDMSRSAALERRGTQLVDPEPEDRYAPGIDVRTWKQFAPDLFGDFDAIIRNAENTRYRGGTHDDGPMPRIFAAVIPLLTGERPGTSKPGKDEKKRELENIGRQLRSMRQVPRTEN
jgi:hypothetical protein